MAKYVSAEEAVQHIKSGDRVVFSHACGEPLHVVDAMVKNCQAYENVEIVHLLAMGKGEYTKPGMEKHFRHNSLFAGASTRDAINENRADYTPVFFTETPRLFRSGLLPVDVALISVTPPDAHGYCSFGVATDYSKCAAECAKIVIAQLNDRMPRTFGDCFIHIDDIDFAVEHSEQIIELKPPTIGDIESKIGENCAALIQDGATLQLGIGAIPDAVLSFLGTKNDLGIHSEMISDGVLKLVEQGNINNKRKNLNNGKFIVTFLMGTQKLYDFADNNPTLHMHPVDYVNSPVIIGQNDNMVGINSALQVDMMGQVAADTVGHRIYSGVGGQVDFVRGCSYSKGGISIIALPSTAGGGKFSRIVPQFEAGRYVTTTRNDVHYIVTEYGAALMRGQTLKQRGRNLIEIAHPDFRAPMIEEWEKRFASKF